MIGQKDDGPMAQTILEEVVKDRRLLYRHTVDEYDRMIANRLIEEGAPYELLDGQVVRKLRNANGDDAMTVGVEHALVVMRLAKLDRFFEPLGCHVRPQQPIALPPHDEPEPDISIARGGEDDYKDHHPSAGELLAVVEVSDASLSRDRGYKLALYANFGIETYVIVNLVDRVVEVYTDPVKGAGRYAKSGLLRGDAEVTFPTPSGQPVTVAARTLLP